MTSLPFTPVYTLEVAYIYWVCMEEIFVPAPHSVTSQWEPEIKLVVWGGGALIHTNKRHKCYKSGLVGWLVSWGPAVEHLPATHWIPVSFRDKWETALCWAGVGEGRKSSWAGEGGGGTRVRKSGEREQQERKQEEPDRERGRERKREGRERERKKYLLSWGKQWFSISKLF